MDINPALLPSGRLLKPETSAKDKKQKDKYSQQAEWVSKDIKETRQELEKVSDNEWTAQDRRVSEDRRLKQDSRGRWLESREKKDRRKAAKIYVQI